MSSHGIALGCIVDGIPPGMSLCEQDIQSEPDRRKPGTSRYTTPAKKKIKYKFYQVYLREKQRDQYWYANQKF